MKREKWITAGVGTAMGFLLAFGSVGSLASAFDFSADFGRLAMICLIFALAAGICSLWKWGRLALLGVSAVLLGYFWRSGELTAQFGALLYEISRRYDSGYGWGYLDFPAGELDLALQCVGALIAADVSQCVCRRQGGLIAATLALLPLFACCVVTDTVPAAGYLFAFLLGMILLVLTGYMRANTPDQANYLTLLAAVPVAAALGILFWAIPEGGYVNRAQERLDSATEWFADAPAKLEELFSPEETPSVDIPDEVLDILVEASDREYDLGAQGARSALQSGIAVMDVLAESSGTLYLRGQDYDTYTGTTWTAGTRREEDFVLGWSVTGVDAGEVTVTTRWEWDILYVPYYPEDGLTLKGGSRENQDGLTYSFGRRALPTNWRLLVTGGAAGEVDDRYLQLPKNTGWAGDLLDTILTDEQTATEKADAIADYVKGSAAYDLGTGRMPAGEEDFAQWFLYESDTGYCVHFATAAAVLLRAAGVECRYVTGYLVHAEAGKTVTVSADQSHAWVEYYEPSLDTWIVLEATPASADSPVEESGTETTAPTETVAGTLPRETGDTASQETADVPASEPDDPNPEPEAPRDLRWLRDLLLWLGIPALLAAAVAERRMLLLGRRRKKCREGDPNSRALALWRETLRVGKVLKIPTPELLEELAQKAKFSQHTLTEEELELFESYLRSAQNVCRAKPWYAKILYRWVYVLY